MIKLKCKITNADGSKSLLTTIELDGNVPFMNMTDLVMSNHQLSTNDISVVTPTNILIDPIIDNRYTFLFSGTSGYSGIEYAIYYDTVTNEIYSINNPDYLDVDNMENAHIPLYGYKIGTRKLMLGAGLSMVGESTECKLPIPTGTLTSVTMVQLNLHGINTNRSFTLDTTLDTNSSGRASVNLNTFIKVDITTLFGDDVKIPSNIIYPNVPGKFKNVYTGEISPNHLYIPLPV